MNLQEKWIASFENKEDILKDTRAKALAFFKENGFPSRKDEAWKFSNIAALTKKDFSIVSQTQNKVSENEISKFFIGANSYKIVFVDGFFAEELSNIQTNEFSFSSLKSVLSSEKGSEIIENYFNKETRKTDVFTALNIAFGQDGFFLHIGKNKVVEKPIEVLFITSNHQKEVCTQPHNIVVVEENAQVKIVESHYNLSSFSVLTNAVTEGFVGKNALLDYYKIQNDTLESSLIDNTYISQEKGGNASVHTFSFGGDITRNNLNFYHKGEYLDSTLKGISILNGTQQVDNYTLVNHAEPNCESHQDYKAILSDKSSGVFNGKIMVEKIAQKTNAYQQNDTILLSEKATINTKPQLEIFADDVKCSHGCTVGELNKEALFYLQTRGIPKKEGEALLTYAFANTVLESVKIPELETYISALISNKLDVNINL